MSCCTTQSRDWTNTRKRQTVERGNMSEIVDKKAQVFDLLRRKEDIAEQSRTIDAEINRIVGEINQLEKMVVEEPT